jgi:hypothetical protein
MAWAHFGLNNIMADEFGRKKEKKNKSNFCRTSTELVRLVFKFLLEFGIFYVEHPREHHVFVNFCKI